MIEKEYFTDIFIFFCHCLVCTFFSCVHLNKGRRLLIMHWALIWGKNCVCAFSTLLSQEFWEPKLFSFRRSWNSEGEMVQVLMLTVAAPGVCVTPECEHIHKQWVPQHFYGFILLSCYERDGNCSLWNPYQRIIMSWKPWSLITMFHK